MAETTYTADLLVSTWGRELFREAGPMIYFKKFMGKSANNIIQTKTELQGTEGDDVTFGLLMRMTASGVTGDSTLEGQEESLVTYSQNVTIDQVRNAVRSKGRLHNRSHLFNFRENARSNLAVWLAEYVDTDAFDTFSASPTRALGEDAAGSYRYDGTYKSSLATGDVVTVKGFNILKKLAKEPYNVGELKIRPVNVEGRNHYVLILSGEALYDLKQDSTWTQGNREARERGRENPIFSGASYIYDGIIIHDHENITAFTDGGGDSVRGSLNLFLGAQAGLYALADAMLWDEKKFDYGSKHGVAAGQIYGFAKATFNSEDFATMVYCTSNTQISA